MRVNLLNTLAYPLVLLWIIASGRPERLDRKVDHCLIHIEGEYFNFNALLAEGTCTSRAARSGICFTNENNVLLNPHWRCPSIEPPIYPNCRLTESHTSWRSIWRKLEWLYQPLQWALSLFEEVRSVLESLPAISSPAYALEFRNNPKNRRTAYNLSLDLRRHLYFRHDFHAMHLRAQLPLMMGDIMYATNTACSSFAYAWVAYVRRIQKRPTVRPNHEAEYLCNRILGRAHAKGPLPSTTFRKPVFTGGACRSSFVPYELLSDHIATQPNITEDILSTSRFKYSAHIDDVALLSYPSEEFLHTKIPIADLIKILPLAQAKNLAKLHGIPVTTRTTAPTLNDAADCHNCSKCTTHFSVFSLVKSKKALATERVQKHRLLQKNKESPALSEDGPPTPADRATKHSILTRACKRMSSKTFEESGCGVCGELKPMNELSRLKNIKNYLDVLISPGTTRVERKSAGAPVKEYSGPVLDYSCNMVCNGCRVSLRNGKVPRLALANGLWLGKVPEVLKDLRFVEKMLIARVRHTCAYVKVASGMRKMKANIVAFESPIPKIYQMLPPPREDLDDVLAILFTGPCKPTPEDFKRTPLLVRRKQVIRALEWLKLNHRDYADIEISRENMEQYSEDQPPVSVEYREAVTNKVPEGTSTFDQEEEDGTEEGDCPYTVHGLTGEMVDTMPPNQIKAAALRHLNNGGKMLAVGHSSTLESMYNNPQLYPQMFPWLFPYGLGGIGTTPLSDKEHKRHLLMYHDKRFQIDVDFPFVAFSHAQIKTSTTQGFLLVEQKRFTDMTERLMNANWETMNSLARRMESGEYVKPTTPAEEQCFQIIKDLDAMSGKMHGSVASKKFMRNEIWSLIARIGAPSWYITLSPADNRHPICVYLAGFKEKFDPIPLPYAERTRLVCNNPVAGARFFHFMVESFLEDVLGFESSHKGLYGETSGFYGTVEQQGRLTLHLHIMIWIKGMLTPQELRDKMMGPESAWQKKIISYLESCHTGDFTAGTQQDARERRAEVEKGEGYIDPTESLPKQPPQLCRADHNEESAKSCKLCQKYNDWVKNFNEEVDDLILRSNVHSCQRGVNKDGSRKKTMATAGCMDNKWGKCKARFPRPVYQRSFVDNLGTVFLKKVEPWINTLTPLVTYIFRCNSDVTSLSSGTAIKAVTMYVSDYITKCALKTHTIFDSIRSVYNKNSEMIGGTLPMKEKARRFMTKVVNLLSAKAEMGAPMISMYLLGNPDHYTSHTFVPFYWQTYVSHVRSASDLGGNQGEGEKITLIRKGGRIIGLSHVFDYIYRSSELENVSLYEWARCYERVKIASKSKASQSCGSGDGDEEEGAGTDADASKISIDASDLPEKKSSGRAKNIHKFGSGHPLHETHAMKFFKNNSSRVPNFVGATLPRRDKGDREYYCCTMLTIFKPWRKMSDLRVDESLTWDEHFHSHSFAPDEERFMQNFNIRYECMDARDDYRAQMKKGTADIVGNWDPSADDNDEDCEEHPFIVNTDQADDVTDGDLLPGRTHLRRLKEIESVKEMMTLLGWAAANEAVPTNLCPMKPTKSISASQWEHEVEKRKQEVIQKKNENNRPKPEDPSASAISNGANCFLENVVKIVDRAFLHKSYVNVEHSGAVLATATNFSLNTEQERAFTVIANHSICPNAEQLCMYLGGMGGTGKSQVLKALACFFAERNEAHRFVIVAPTGTAAALLGGSTYHSMLGINDRAGQSRVGIVKARLTGVNYVFLDEVSMLSARDLYRIHNQLTRVLGVSDLPFGGMNMVFSGDFAQLPPAIGGERVGLYSRFIGAVGTDLRSQEEAIGKALWHQVTTVVILRENMRQRTQSEEDTKLRTALENMRYKSCTLEDIEFLRTKISSAAPHRSSICDEGFRNVSIITGTNLHKDEINRLGAIRFAAETGQTLTEFFSEDSEKVNPKDGNSSKGVRFMQSISDDVQSLLWNQPPSFTDKHIAGKLSLCIGMPVMIRYNYATELCMTRGQEGHVVGWQQTRGSRGQLILDTLFVELKSPPSEVQLDGLPCNVVPVYPTNNVINTTLPSGNKYHIQRKQVEVQLNFAMTDFASQGKTRDRNTADLNNLMSHQAYYTALSRSASAKGTLILQGFDGRKITGGCSGALRQEFRELEMLDAITALNYEEKLPPNVCGKTRNELIRTFREWKGLQFIPKAVHKAIRWSKRDPFVESVIDIPPNLLASGIPELPPKPDDTQRNEPAKNVKKRRRSDQLLSTSPTKSPPKKVQRTITADQPRTSLSCFRWDNNSCAYDSLFSVLLMVWRSNPEVWKRALGEYNAFLSSLILNFEREMAHDLTLENARDNIRRLLHDHNPVGLAFGQYTSLDNLFGAMLQTDRLVSQIAYTCTCNRAHPVDEHKQLHRSAGANLFASTSQWLQTEANLPSGRRCSTCNDYLRATHAYLEAPPLLCLDFSGTRINIDHSLTVLANGVLRRYQLKGVLYFGGAHFVSVIIHRGSVWYHDGMQNGGACSFLGNLAPSPSDLQSRGGRQAVAAIYTLADLP